MSTDAIEMLAVSEVRNLFLVPYSRIKPVFSENDKTPLFDGCIFLYQNNNINNDNSLDKIDVQIKGETQQGIIFTSNIKFSIDTNLIKIGYRNFGFIFFVVRIENQNYKPCQVYYKLLDSQFLKNILGKAQNQGSLSIELNKFKTLEEFHKECDYFYQDKSNLLKLINTQSTMRLPSSDNQEIYHQTIYIRDKKIFGQHPLLNIYFEIKKEMMLSSQRIIVFIGEPRLGKSFEMLELYSNIKEKNSELVRYLDLSQYQGDYLDKTLELNDENLSYNILLDGYDEISPYHMTNFNKEFQRIVSLYNSSFFVISTRENEKNNIPQVSTNAGFFKEIYLVKNTVEDEIENNNEISEKILVLSSSMQELLLIPMYRPIINEADENVSIYDSLINRALLQNRNKIIKKYGERSLPSDDIIIQDLILIAKNMRESRNSIIQADSQYKTSLIFQTDFFKTNDDTNFTFSNKTYYDYFIARYYLSLTFSDISNFFFINEKIKIATIDIFIILLDLLKYNNKKIYVKMLKFLENSSIEAFLICDVNSLTNDERYNYFIQILDNRNNNNNSIYYARFRPVYGPLKGVENMAKKMQLLLPENKRNDAIDILKTNILNFLNTPADSNLIKFANSIILLTPFINKLWSSEQEVVLREISLPILQFFIYNKLAKNLEGLLSHKFIFDWYKDYNWTDKWEESDWELFFKDISGKTYNLADNIIGEHEYAIKLECFVRFYDNNHLRPLLIPLLCYLFKNKYNQGHRIGSYVPDTLTDDYQSSVTHFNYDSFAITHVIPNIDMTTKEILSVLYFAVENNLYQHIKDTFESPITILEDKLYQNINLLEEADFKSFTTYYLKCERYGMNDKLFKTNQSLKIDQIKKYMLNYIFENPSEINQLWILTNVIHNLINLSNYDEAIKQLIFIKENKEDRFYDDIIYYTFNNKNHILNNTAYINSEYNKLFKELILSNEAKEKYLAQLSKKIEDKKSHEIELMLDKEAMVNELIQIDDYLNNTAELNEETDRLFKLRSLKYNRIHDDLMYKLKDQYLIPPVFSRCAIGILDDYYGQNIFNIDEIIEDLTSFLFKQEHYYLYFYWVYIENKEKSKDFREIILNTIEGNIVIKQLIIDSINIYARQRFDDDPVTYFDGGKNSPWVTPFLYYFDLLYKESPLAWLKNENILKLITFINPNGAGFRTSIDIGLDWFEKQFPWIKNTEIIDFGLQIYDDIESHLSRIQLAKYFLNFYISNVQSIERNKIHTFIIKTTIRMFNKQYNGKQFSEYSTISSFWAKCQENYIEVLFPKFVVDNIISIIRSDKDDINFQYRKEVLEYCIRLSVDNNIQKERIIEDLGADLKTKTLSENESDVVKQFLAALGNEESIISLIDLYLNGKDLVTPYIFNQNSFGIIKQSDSLLYKYEELFFYSTEKSNDRRNSLFYLSKNGIEQHLTKKNYPYFEKQLTKHIKSLKDQNKWTEYYEEFLLQMEQYVFSGDGLA
ncbi:hypothetical protein FACS189483_03650 [Spirochaetia bacterium]|nr:hypothetical protein FACS189483_03650 [Spirochaetia bacterium]